MSYALNRFAKNEKANLTTLGHRCCSVDSLARSREGIQTSFGFAFGSPAKAGADALEFDSGEVCG
jgi:hypothetical protein